MRTCVALLRGINVGGHHKVPMAELRAILKYLGLKKPGTIGASGNAWFEVEAAEALAPLSRRIASALEDRFGFAVPIVLRWASDLHAIAQTHPFAAEGVDPRFLHVVFLSETPPAAAALPPEALPPDRAELRGQHVFVHYTRGSARSGLTLDKLERWLSVRATGRNWNTVRKLALKTGMADD